VLEGNKDAMNKAATNMPCKIKDNNSHLGNRSSDLPTEKDLSHKLIVAEDAFSATDDYPSSEETGRVTMPNFSMPACLISAMVFITRP